MRSFKSVINSLRLWGQNESVISVELVESPAMGKLIVVELIRKLIRNKELPDKTTLVIS